MSKFGNLSRLTAVWILVFSCFVMADAQQTAIDKTIEKYKNMTTLTANVTRTQHKAALTKDVVSNGTFYYKREGTKMCMTFNGGKDKLIMNSGNFTMVTNGKATTAKGNKNKQVSPMLTALGSIFKGGGDVDLSDVADVEISQSGGSLVLTLSPLPEGGKKSRSQAFSKIELRINKKTNELQRLIIHEKGKDYTQFDFSGFKYNAPVADKYFKP